MITSEIDNIYEDKANNSNSGCDSACEVVDIDKIYLTTHIDEILDEDMTSLNTLVLLGQTNLKTSEMRSDGIGRDENYRLSMAYERLQRIPAIILEEIAPYVKILDISHNEFSNLDFLREFKQLHSLICDHNNITSNVELPYLPNLELLWLNHCKINELYPWARKLRQSCPNLKYLSLMGNAAAPSYLNGGNFYEYIQYRLFVISLFPKLVHLDDRSVTNDQRLEAKRMYKRPLLERITLKAPPTLPTYLKSVSDKVSGMFASVPDFVTPAQNKQRNIIV